MNSQIITQLAGSKADLNSPTICLVFFIAALIVGVFAVKRILHYRTGRPEDADEAGWAFVNCIFAFTLAFLIFVVYMGKSQDVASSYVWAEKTIAAIQDPSTKVEVEVAEGSKQITSLLLNVEPTTKEETFTVLGKGISAVVQEKEGFQTKLNAAQLAILDKGQVKLADGVAKQIQLAMGR